MKGIIILSVIIAGILCSCASGTSEIMTSSSGAVSDEEVKKENQSIVQEKTTQESMNIQDEMLAEYAREKYKGECQPFDYREYFRYEDKYKGTKVYLTAQIVQIIGESELRCYSNAGDEYLIRDKREADSTRLLVDDEIIIWGEYAGTEKRVRAINNVEEEVLTIDARYIDILTTYGTQQSSWSGGLGAGNYTYLETETWESEFVFPYSDIDIIPDYELICATDEQLRIGKNEIYANHGRIFKDQELQRYFNSCSWYTPSVRPEDFNESVFNQTEKDNIMRIQAEIDRRAASN